MPKTGYVKPKESILIGYDENTIDKVEEARKNNIVTRSTDGISIKGQIRVVSRSTDAQAHRDNNSSIVKIYRRDDVIDYTDKMGNWYEIWCSLGTAMPEAVLAGDVIFNINNTYIQGWVWADDVVEHTNQEPRATPIHTVDTPNTSLRDSVPSVIPISQNGDPEIETLPFFDIFNLTDLTIQEDELILENADPGEVLKDERIYHVVRTTMRNAIINARRNQIDVRIPRPDSSWAAGWRSKKVADSYYRKKVGNRFPESWHCSGMAIDIMIIDNNGRYIGNPGNDGGVYRTFYEYVKAQGNILKWGGLFENRADWGHFELSNSIGYSSDGSDAKQFHEDVSIRAGVEAVDNIDVWINHRNMYIQSIMTTAAATAVAN